MNDTYKNCDVQMQPGRMEIMHILVGKSTEPIGWRMHTMSIPSVRVTIWANGEANYSHIKKNANPEDEKNWYLKQMKPLYKFFHPCIEIYNNDSGKQYLIYKKNITFMEFKWVDDEGV